MVAATLAAISVMTSASTLRLDLDKPGIAVSPMLYGLMTEEINYSYDGGLYAELVRNRSFRDHKSEARHWAPIGRGGAISLLDSTGDERFPTGLRVKGGVSNEGYWGMPVRPETTYRLVVWAKSDKPTSIAAALESARGSVAFASGKIAGVGTKWKRHEIRIKTAKDVEVSKNARLGLRIEGDATVDLAFVSLFPPTYKNRANGNRPDLMKMLKDMKPAFLRFPGGNYLEGNLIEERFKWWETLGPVEFRKGHPCPWGYRSSDGMGLLEFLLWCEDIGAEPLLGVYAGYSLRGDYIKPGPDLEPYVQEALDEIEYVIGGTDTKWGAQRAKDGHPEPFKLRYVEVGNEDGFDKSRSYEDRFVQFYDAIRAKYPHLKIISSTGGKDSLGSRDPINKRRPDLWDEHYYSEAWDMMGMATKYDSYDRNAPKVFVGEWAAHDTHAPWVAGPNAGPTPNMKCTIGDAAFMTGMERNSDVVEMHCYAPLLVNANKGGRQWSLNMIGYDVLNAYGSPSYYAQVMFANNVGDRTVPQELIDVPTQKKGDRTLPAIFASATVDSKTGDLFVKVVNALADRHKLTLSIPGSKANGMATWTELTGELKTMNDLKNPKRIAPTTKRIKVSGDAVELDLSGHSVNVLRIPAAK